MKIKKSTSSKKAIILVVSILCVILAATAVTIAIKGRSSSTPATVSSTSSNQSDSANSTDQGTSNSIKDNDADSKATPSSEQSTTNMVIVDATTYDQSFEVRAYVDVVSNSGTCTYTFTQGSSTLIKTTTSSPSANSTSCTTLDIPVAEFVSKGTWQMTASYKSGSISGTTSRSVEVE